MRSSLQHMPCWSYKSGEEERQSGRPQATLAMKHFLIKLERKWKQKQTSREIENPWCCLSWCAGSPPLGGSIRASLRRRGNHLPSWLFHSVPSPPPAVPFRFWFVPLFDPPSAQTCTLAVTPSSLSKTLLPCRARYLDICLICFWMLASSFCCGF